MTPRQTWWAGFLAGAAIIGSGACVAGVGIGNYVAGKDLTTKLDAAYQRGIIYGQEIGHLNTAVEFHGLTCTDGVESWMPQPQFWCMATDAPRFRVTDPR